MILNRVIFLIILFSVWNTRFDYVYLVWFFIINDAPGRLFTGGGGEESLRIPIYTLGPGFSFSFQDLFILIYITKYIINGVRWIFLFRRDLIWFYLVGVLFLLYSIVLGMSLDTLIADIRALLPWSFLFILPYYIQNKNILVRVSLMLFPFVVLAFASQIYSYITGEYLVHTLKLVEGDSMGVRESDVASRFYSAVYIILVSVILALYFFYSRNSKIPRVYLSIVILIGTLSIFLTATRGWILGIGALFLGIIITFGFTVRFVKTARLLFLAIIGIVMVLTLLPRIEKQIELSYERLATIESLAEGDITAEGTLVRLDVRGPKVLSKFNESPVLGWGFSNEYLDYADAHVGNINLLMSTGLLGFIYLNVLYFLMVFKTIKLSRNKSIRRQEGNAPLIFAFGLLTIFIIHSTSTQFWGYLMHFDQLQKILSFSFIIASINSIRLSYPHMIPKIQNTN